jgi:hypothetical protein
MLRPSRSRVTHSARWCQSDRVLDLFLPGQAQLSASGRSRSRISRQVSAGIADEEAFCGSYVEFARSLGNNAVPAVEELTFTG